MLRNDERAARGFDGFAILGRKGWVGDNRVYFAEVAEAGEGLLAELSGVYEEDNFLGLFHHFSFGLDEEEVLVVEGVVVDAGYAEEEGLGVDGGEDVFGGG